MGLTARDYVKTEQQAHTPPPGTMIDIVPFGFYHVDLNFLMGVMPTMPQLRSFQGLEGNRKTSLAFNLIINMVLSGNLPMGHKITYDILESGMTLEKCMAVIRCMVATKYIIYKHYTGAQPPKSDEDILRYLKNLFDRNVGEFEHGNPADLLEQITFNYNGAKIPECSLKYDLIRKWYLGKTNLTPLQNEAWIIAGEALAQFPLEFFGISGHYDRNEAMKRSTPTRNIEQSYERWTEMVKEYDSVQFFVDHLNAYDVPGDDYRKQIEVMPYIARFIEANGVTFWMLHQEGMSNRKDYDTKGEVYGSKGGTSVKAEADTNWRVSYPKTSPFYMILHQPVKSREGDHPDLKLMIEPNSGAIFGKSRIHER